MQDHVLVNGLTQSVIRRSPDASVAVPTAADDGLGFAKGDEGHVVALVADVAELGALALASRELMQGAWHVGLPMSSRGRARIRRAWAFADVGTLVEHGIARVVFRLCYLAVALIPVLAAEIVLRARHVARCRARGVPIRLVDDAVDRALDLDVSIEMTSRSAVARLREAPVEESLLERITSSFHIGWAATTACLRRGARAAPAPTTRSARTSHRRRTG